MGSPGGSSPAGPATPSSLWRHADFLRLWTAETISVFGSQFTGLALPLTAVILLNAGPVEMGLLGAAGTLPFLLFGLLIGVWVDRSRRRPILVLADLGRGTALAVIPLAWVFGVLGIPMLYMIGFAVGVLTVFFDVAYQSYLPSLVGRAHIVEANSRLEVSRSTSSVAGPTLAGIAIQFIAAPIAILIDAISFWVSALFIGRIRSTESAPDASRRRSMLAEAWEGLSIVFRDSRLWHIAGCTGTLNFFSSAIFALFVLFAVQDLGVNPFGLGLVFGIGSLGALSGAFVSSRLAKRWGVGPIIVASAFIHGLGGLPLILANPLFAIPALVATQVVWGLSTVVYNVNQVSLRQSIVPDHLQGRMNASMRFLVWGTLPLGAVAGGFLGAFLGLRPAMTVAVVGSFFGFLWVYASPVRSLRRIEDAMPRS